MSIKRTKQLALFVIIGAVMTVVTACGSIGETGDVRDPGPIESTSVPTKVASSEASTDATVAPVSDGLDVSGEAVGTMPFGTAEDLAVEALGGALGDVDLTRGPMRYTRIAGADGWYEVGGDEISPSWEYEFASVSCWGTFCAIFGGDTAQDLALRGWELADYNRWDTSDGDGDGDGDGGGPDVRLSGSGITLGDSWADLHDAYPQAVAGPAEGASLAVDSTPWPGIFDGVAGWRLSGYWDAAHSSRVPADSVVTRLSGGEGPEPGCC